MFSISLPSLLGGIAAAPCRPAYHAHGRACRLAPSDTLAERIAPRLHGLDRGLHFRGQREDDRCVPTVVGGRIPEYHRCGLLRRLARAGVAPAETPLDRHHERAVEWGCRHPGGVWVHGLPPKIGRASCRERV